MASRPDRTTTAAEPSGRSGPSGRRIVLFCGLGLVVLLIAAAAWVGIRAVLAQSHLEMAMPLAKHLESRLVAGDTATAQHTASEFADQTGAAAKLTSDPVWRAAEIIPGLGVNLRDVRQAARITNTVAQKAIVPLARVAGGIDLNSLAPKGGAIDLAPLQKAAPMMRGAAAVMKDARLDAHAIDTKGAIGPVASAVHTLTHTLDTAADATTALSNAVQVLPGMLGADGPRNILLLMQNPAELRSTGGVPGAMAVIHTDGGRISLGHQVSDLDFHHFDTSVLPLPAGTESLYGTRPGRYIQNTNMTPYFPLTAKLTTTMWERRFGLHLDGVLKVDPVTLSYLLKATGPITVADGRVLTSQNAVPFLLSTIYQKYSGQSAQDAFFASAASSIFDTLMSGKGDTATLIKGLARAGAEHRILIWSRVASEQKILAGTTLAGGLPASTPELSRFGVYFNDSTGSKMDYYLDATVATGSRVCRSDGHPNTRVSVTMRSTAPRNAATALPVFVAGPVPGTAPRGHVRNVVSVYAPPGSVITAVTSAGKAVPANVTKDRGRSVAQFQVDLAPGASKQVDVDLVQLKSTATATEAITTPGLHVSTRTTVAPACRGGVN